MKTREIALEYQELIFQPPETTASMYQQACSNDGGTINYWRDIWLKNIRVNHEKHGPFKENGIGHLFGRCRYQPVIIAGSGPSLKYNADKLKDRNGIILVSCLHNFHYLEDVGASPDFYVSLDAGPVTIEEVSEGGSLSPEEYWEKTKDRTLIAFIGSDPELIDKWQGKIYWFQAPIPDQIYMDETKKIENFNQLVSTGGNVLGVCLYISKAWFGSGATIFVGADFSFGYDRKFHSWSSKYDAKMGRCIPQVDIYGNKVPTWQSYANFKKWFDYISLKVPGIYINASEGGCLGSYPQGNLNSFRYMDLDQVIDMYSMCDKIKEQAINPECEGEASIKVLF